MATAVGKFRADALAAKVPKRACQKLSAGATLVQVAGSRWRVEETFQAGKGLAGPSSVPTNTPVIPPRTG